MQFHFSGWSHFKMRGARHIFEQQHILAFGATVHMYTSLPSHCRVRAIAKHIPRLLIFFVIFLRWFWIFFIIVRICSGFTRAFSSFLPLPLLHLAFLGQRASDSASVAWVLSNQGRYQVDGLERPLRTPPESQARTLLLLYQVAGLGRWIMRLMA